MRTLSIAVLCLLGAASAVKIGQCNAAPLCAAPAPAPACACAVNGGAGGAGGALLNCPDLNTKGYG